jgi:hypothetical protein
MVRAGQRDIGCLHLLPIRRLLFCGTRAKHARRQADGQALASRTGPNRRLQLLFDTSQIFVRSNLVHDCLNRNVNLLLWRIVRCAYEINSTVREQFSTSTFCLVRARLENCNGVTPKVFHETETGDVGFAISYEHHVCEGNGSILRANILVELAMPKTS